jgi:hypothetical protein
MEVNQTTYLGKYIWHNTNLFIRITRTTIAIIRPPHPAPMAMNNASSFSLKKTNYMNVMN